MPGFKPAGEQTFQNLSVDQTTMMTNNQSLMQQQSPSQVQASQDGGQQISTETPGAGGNLLNFAAAPHTQRAPINLEAQQDALNATSDRERQSNNTIDHYAGLAGGARGTKQHSIDAAGKKKVQQEARLSLQPKLIQPPSKLMKTLDHQGAKASHVKKKPQQFRSHFDE